MRKVVLFAILAVIMSAGSGSVRADETQDGHCPGPRCKPRTKPVCFNLVCNYENEHDRDHKSSCTVASTFIKDVTEDGGEVVDDSNGRDNPSLVVNCGGERIFSNSARRFTDLLGTRIQGQEGPNPAITLPRGALHSGADGQSGGHYSPSTLELQGHNDFERFRGKCFIWTGLP